MSKFNWRTLMQWDGVSDAAPVDATNALHIRTIAETSLLKYEFVPGTELRADETLTDRYHGRAIDGTATTSATWEVIRFYKDATGNVTRTRYRTGVAWDDRATGWT